jgi:3-phosphoshikimate 1-carboxyvinyltransferase
MGVYIKRAEDTIIATSQRGLSGVSIDGNKTIDSIPVIAAATCYASSPSHIYNIANLHFKESDRINDLARELNKAGCQVFPSEDAIEIHPADSDGIYGGVELDAHSDHRLIEAFTAIGLATKHPITISNAIHIAKSYLHFFDDLIALGARIEQII